MELPDSPSIRAMTVSSVGSSTSSVTGDLVVVLETVDVRTLLRLLLVGVVAVGDVSSRPVSVLGLVIKSTPSDVLAIPVVDDRVTFAVVGGILLGNALALIEGLVIEESSAGFRVLETELVGLEAFSEVSVVTAALVEDVSFVGGSVLLLCVVSASLEIAVVTAASVVDVSSVGGSVLLLIVVSASSDIAVVSAALVADACSVGGSVALTGVVVSLVIDVVTSAYVVDASSVGGSALPLGVVSASSRITAVSAALVVDVCSVGKSVLLPGVV